MHTLPIQLIPRQRKCIFADWTFEVDLNAIRSDDIVVLRQVEELIELVDKFRELLEIQRIVFVYVCHEEHVFALNRLHFL